MSSSSKRAASSPAPQRRVAPKRACRGVPIKRFLDEFQDEYSELIDDLSHDSSELEDDSDGLSIHTSDDESGPRRVPPSGQTSDESDLSDFIVSDDDEGSVESDATFVTEDGLDSGSSETLSSGSPSDVTFESFTGWLVKLEAVDRVALSQLHAKVKAFVKESLSRHRGATSGDE